MSLRKKVWNYSKKGLRVSYKLVGIVAFLLWLIFMFIIPIWSAFSNNAWAGLFKTWHDWQSLNVGILAFAASVIALYVTKYRVNDDNRRNLIAAKVFLPSALSQLAEHNDKCAQIILSFYKACQGMNYGNKKVEMPAPEKINEGPIKAISDCIKYSDNTNNNEYLCLIIEKMQIQNSRIVGLNELTQGETGILTAKRYLCEAAYIRLLLSDTFDYARRETDTINHELVRDKFINAFYCMGDHILDDNKDIYEYIDDFIRMESNL